MTRRKPSEKVLVCLLLFILSISLRLVRLDAGLWEDEITTLTRFASQAWLQALTEIPYPNNHLLYTLLLKLSLLIFGEHEWSARLPALALGSLTPPVFYLVMSRRFSWFAAICSGLFSCLNYWMVWFSQDARGYSGMFLFGMLGTYFFLEFIERNQRRSGAAYVLCATLACYFHLYAIFLIAAQLIWAAVGLLRKKIPASVLGHVLAAGVLGLVLYLPGASQLYHYTVTDARLGAQVSHMRFDPAMTFGKLLLMMAGTKNQVVGAIIALAALPGLAVLARKWRGFLAVNLIAVFLISAFTVIARVFIFPRFLFFVYPVFLFALALGVDALIGQLNSKSLKNIFCILLPVVIALGLIPPLADYYRLGKEPFKAAAEYAWANHPGMPLVTSRRAMKYYMPEAIATPGASPDLDMVRDKLVFVRNLEWRKLSGSELAGHCRLEKVWPSAGFEEHDFLLLYCQ
jgi:mannosyltransferase